MLRAAIKHGITKALSTRAGFEVWDFEIKEEQPSPDRVTIELRYRYHPNLCFSAAITAKSADGKVPTYEITAEAVPGEVGDKEILLLAGRQELFTAIERWTTRIEEELSARPSNRVLEAQQKAISFLQKRLLDIPDQRLTRDQITEYRRRLERLEAAVIELRANREVGTNGTRAEAVQQEFAVLRNRLEVLGERNFLHAVLVRLVKYFWDDENLRIIEAGSRAAQDFLKEQERSLAAAKPETPAAARPAPPAEPPVPTRAAKAEAAASARPPMPAPTRPQAKPEPAPAHQRAPAPAKAAASATAKAPASSAPKATASPPSKAAATEPAKPAQKPATNSTAAPTAAKQRAEYKPLRPARG